MNYAMTLIIGRKELSVPVLPDKLSVKSSGKNDKTTVLLLGEILILRKKALRSISWDSFFPVNNAPFVTGEITEPIDAVKAIQKARDTDKPIRFLITGTDLDMNIRMGIESFEYFEQGGEVGDIYYNIELCEWKDYSPRRIILPKTVGTTATVTEPARAGSPPVEKTHPVVKGDSMWGIAQKHYSDGNRYPELYKANQTTIDKGNLGTGNPRYTIYPGQVLVLP